MEIPVDPFVPFLIGNFRDRLLNQNAGCCESEIVREMGFFLVSPQILFIWCLPPKQSIHHIPSLLPFTRQQCWSAPTRTDRQGTSGELASIQNGHALEFCPPFEYPCCGLCKSAGCRPRFERHPRESCRTIGARPWRWERWWPQHRVGR